MKNNSLKLAVALAAACAVPVAFAGGPLMLAEPGQPLAWDVSTPVQVYTDLGNLCDTDTSWPYSGCLSNEQADALVAFGFDQWTAVSSSSFQAEIAGDFSAIGLGDITGDNAGEIVDTWNGGGYHVMYDTDGSIIQDFFGGSVGVLGISSPEWGDGNGKITESWAVINVASVPEGDDGTAAAGVFTHEFGHGINLSHSQTNGYITFYGSPWNWEAWAPQSCGAPYDVSVIEDFAVYNEWIETVAIPSLETMYPYIDAPYTGQDQSTVEHPDDVTALSNLYPANGWPASHGAIAGKILLKDGSTELTGINVVARNVANPLFDAVTVMSGDQTQGLLGPDGEFVINGLTPGAEYVLYVEEIRAGGFPTPVAAMPSVAEYWNIGESNIASQDDPCAWTAIAAVAGEQASADIAFNGVPRSPKLVTIPVDSATDVDNSGRNVVGTYGGALAWRYDTTTGVFDVVESSANPRLARDGQTMVAELPPVLPTWEGGEYAPGLWHPKHGWTLFDLPEGQPGCSGTVFSPWDLDAQGKQVVGLYYTDGCAAFQAGLWSAKDGLQALETPDFILPETECGYDWNTGTPIYGCEVYGSRANSISGDGSLVVGHVDAVGWKGAAWIDGALTMIGADDPKGWVGSANDVNHDGTFVVGGEGGDDGSGYGSEAYIWSPATGTRTLGNFALPCEDVDPWLCNFQPEVIFATEGFGVSDKGDIVVGRGGDRFSGMFGIIWTEATGMLQLNEFLQNQGVMEAFTTDFVSPLAVSGDGKTIVGWALGTTAITSFALTLDQVWVCRNGSSRLAGFPGGMAAQLDGGATLGLCEADMPITP